MPYTKGFTYKNIENFYERVCYALNATISDEQIDYTENAPLAFIYAKKRVPNWKELDEEKFPLFETCIVYATCYNMCYISNSSYKVTSQSSPTLSVSFAESTQKQNQCEYFAGLIDDLVNYITDSEEEMQNRFFGFLVTHPKEQPEPFWTKKIPAMPSSEVDVAIVQ